MKHKYNKIWKLALEYLKQGVNKDFVIHTEGVIRAMKLILKKEKGNLDVLIPAAILHDVGWAKVPKKYQCTKNKEYKLRGMKLHIEFAPEIIKMILKSLSYKTTRINEIIDIVQAHKFKNPRTPNKKILIDADQLSDAFREQFFADVKAYKSTPEKLYNFRVCNNNFYIKTAKDIFLKQMRQRKKEINCLKYEQ